MSKQEEIREGIAARLEIAYNAGLSKRTCNTNEMARQAVAQLHSQGIVITKFGFYSDLMESLIEEESNGQGLS